tara:strand:+ start:1839 stop:2321 length:483 start_codon:yes stop_codon:yes gene_type:complete
MSKNFRHFKLTNGEEIVCEILDAVDPETSVTDVIARKCMKIISFDDFENNARIYTLKPWMSFLEDMEELIAINSSHIVGESSPSELLTKYYKQSLKDVKKFASLKKAARELDINRLKEDMTEEELESYLDIKFDEVMSEFNDDSDKPSNVIQFKPRGTMH